MIHVSRENFNEVLSVLKNSPALSFDTETTGLRVWHEDSLFCLVFANEGEEFYFNFHPEHPHCLSKDVLKTLEKEVFSSKVLCAHNAKFDMAMLLREGVSVTGQVYDTKILARLIRNDSLRYDLDTVAKTYGFEKDDAVGDFIAKEKLFTKVTLPGTDRAVKLKHFDRVPFEIIAPYACRDARITFDVFRCELAELKRMEESGHESWPELRKLVATETALLKVVFSMEKEGVKIDENFCRESIYFLDDERARLEAEFYRETGEVFLNSSKVFSRVFKDEDIEYGKPSEKTMKVSPKFDSEAMEKFKSPAAKIVLKLRDVKKTADYFHTFLYHADKNLVVHPSFNQDGTATGRFSSSSPNLQNLTAEASHDMPQVRRAFVPKSKDFLFTMFDYSQMEYRLMLDYAGARGLIKKVLDGVDVHQATADLAGISRQAAKTTNFTVLYGGGVKLLSERLKVSQSEAIKIREAIFSSSPEIEQFIKKVCQTAQRRGYIFNWLGRRCMFSDPRFSYKAPNHLIQGGCADIVKLSMLRVHELFEGRRSRLILTIHDELVCEMHRDELFLCAEVKKIMETVYEPRSGLPMAVTVEYSWENLYDTVEGDPAKAGDKI